MNYAFETLKKMFVIILILIQFNQDKETVLETDSSEYITDGLLSQYNEKELL